MDAPNRVLAAAAEIQAFCAAQGWRFCFIGGLAVLHWGEARLTRDADLTVFTGVGDEARHVDALLASFAARVDDARAFALRHRVLLLRAGNGVPIDVSLGALAFEARAADTATEEEIAPGVKLQLAEPGALLVYKAFAGRPRDWLDIEGIIARSGARIDWARVRTELAVLLELKGDSSALARLESMHKRPNPG